MSTFVTDRSSYADDIDAVLVQEANRIGTDIHQENVHTSAWLDLVPKGTFPEGVGYRLQSLIYERALPTLATDATSIGLTWGDFAASALTTGQSHSASVTGISGLLNDSVGDFTNALNNQTIGGSDVAPSHVNWYKRLEPYQLKRATVWSPEINVEDLRFAAYAAEQLAASFDALSEAVRYSWEERHRDEYQRIVHYVVECLPNSTNIAQTAISGSPSATDRFAAGTIGNAGTLANISNEILDRIYSFLRRSGASKNAWGLENMRPVFGLVCSSEASYTLMTESTIRTDVNESSRVDELLQPLGVSKAFRGWYHIIDDLAPRYKASTGAYARVEPYVIPTNVIIPNSEYESNTAAFEVAFVLHKDVMQCLIPNPVGNKGGVSFDPVDYSGKFHWVNIKSVQLNPLGTTGNFLGVLASATKPLKTKFGFAVIYDRTSAVAASIAAP